jgi:hypothetical protein
VAKNVLVLRKSCFEWCGHIDGVVFESGSQLRRVGKSAFSFCQLLGSVVIPASVEVIDDAAFSGCTQLEYCVMEEAAALVSIGNDAFRGCESLRLFDAQRGVSGIGKDCFRGCPALYRFRFRSSECLRNVVGDMTLDEWLEQLGLTVILSIFRIEVDEGEVNLECSGWTPVTGEGSQFTLVRNMY